MDGGCPGADERGLGSGPKGSALRRGRTALSALAQGTRTSAAGRFPGRRDTLHCGAIRQRNRVGVQRLLEPLQHKDVPP